MSQILKIQESYNQKNKNIKIIIVKLKILKKLKNIMNKFTYAKIKLLIKIVNLKENSNMNNKTINK